MEHRRLKLLQDFQFQVNHILKSMVLQSIDLAIIIEYKLINTDAAISNACKSVISKFYGPKVLISFMDQKIDPFYCCYCRHYNFQKFFKKVKI